MALKADDSTALTAVIAGSTELGVHKFKLESIVLDDSPDISPKNCDMPNCLRKNISFVKYFFWPDFTLPCGLKGALNLCDTEHPQLIPRIRL